MTANTNVDLSQLAVDRSPAKHEPNSRRRRWFSRYVVPIGILLSFLGLLAAAAGKSLLPRPTVQVVPVVVKRSSVQRAGTPLFQAAGWVEPRPTANRVAALAPGVIEDLLVVEGQRVEKGQPIAHLIRIDAELALEQAKATLAIREADRNRAIAERDAAKVRLENPVHLQAQLADAKNLLAKANTESAKLPFLIKAAEATVDFTRRDFQNKQAAGEGVAGRAVDQARSEHATAVSHLDELRQRGAYLKNETETLEAKVNALQKQLQLLVEEKRQLQEAEAKVQSASALLDEAKLQVREAELTLQRTVVRAPISGRILKLVALPGSRVMGLDTAAGQNSSTVVEMYDPARLQVRADVRLEDVPMATRGQRVTIETASSEQVIEGRVLQITSTANIQKNTLEVKVELINPPEAVRPEMLVTATFLASPVEQSHDQPTQTERVFIPAQLIRSRNGASEVWIVDADGCAQRQVVETGPSTDNGLMEVIDGLTITDKLIASDTSDLVNGQLVEIADEENPIGFGDETQ